MGTHAERDGSPDEAPHATERGRVELDVEPAAADRAAACRRCSSAPRGSSSPGCRGSRPRTGSRGARSTSSGGPACSTTPPFSTKSDVGERHRLDLIVGDVDARRRRADRGACGCRRAPARAGRRRGSRAARRRGRACGRRTMARPIATRWRWPPESCLREAVEQRPEAEHLRRLVDARARSRPGASSQLAGRTRGCRAR